MILVSGTNLGSVSSVSTRATPSTSMPSAGRMPDERTVADRSSEVGLVGFGSALSSASGEFKQPLHASLVFEAEGLSSELRKRQTTAQSSILDVGYLILHDCTAASTKERAA